MKIDFRGQPVVAYFKNYLYSKNSEDIMSNKTCGFAVIAFLLLFIPASLFAQTPTELRIGTWVPGHLYARQEYWFSVRASGAGFLTVETTGNIDTYLEAYDASRNFIAGDDDGGEGSNAMLDMFVESGRTYLFKLRGYDESVTGPYSIRALFVVVPADAGNTQRSMAVLLRNDDPIPVLFRSPSESRWYRLDLSRQRNLLIVRTTGSVDTYMNLYDSQGRLLAEDDDSGEYTNACLSEKLGPGTYYIEVTIYGGGMGRTTIQAENWYRD
jgi:hypothetical protein